MEAKTICGVYNDEFWVARYNEFSLILIARTTAYRDGEFTPEVSRLLTAYNLTGETIHTDTPMGAAAGIIIDQRVNEFMTPERRDELTKLFTDDTARSI